MSYDPYRAGPVTGGRRSGGGAALRAGLVVGAFIALLWVAEILDTLLGNRLDGHGISPRDPYELPDIVAAPLLHAGFDHLAANTMPLLVLGFLAALRGLSKFFVVSAVIVAVSGLGVWLTAPPDTITLGASGLVFGYFSYVVLRGFLDGKPLDIVVSIVVGLLYGSLIFGVLPLQAGVSWQGHLFGLIGGALAAWLLHGRRRRTPQY
jgi:membrane associated rhomboid family serine protease